MSAGTAPSPAAKLRVRTAGGDVAEHALGKDVLAIGRVMGNDVVLPDVEKRVSSKHARIERDGPAWRIVDLGSANGTFLNDLRLEAHAQTPLKDGDEITIGPFRLSFLREEAVDGPDRRTAALAEALARLAPDAPEEALLRALEAGVAGLPPGPAREVLARTRERFERFGAGLARALSRLEGR